MSIGPGAAKIGVPYLVEYEGEQWTGFRVPRVRPINSGVLVPPRREKETTAWFFMRHDDDAGFISQNSFYADDQDFGEIVPLVPSRNVTREEAHLTAEEAKAAHDNWMAASKRADRAEAELARRNEELSEAEDEIAAQKRLRDSEVEYWSDRAEKAEAERDELQAQLKDAKDQRDHYMERLAMRHAHPKLDATEYRRVVVGGKRPDWAKPTLNRMQVEQVLDFYFGHSSDEVQREAADKLLALAPAAENRPTLDREAVEAAIARWLAEPSEGDDDAAPLVDAIMSLTPAVEGWPEWLGPRREKPEVERAFGGDWLVDEGLVPAGPSAQEHRTMAYRRLAIADFIEREQAATGDEDQRVEEWSRKAAHIMAQSACDEELSQSHEVIAILAERLIPRGRALVDAGWTPPESEA